MKIEKKAAPLKEFKNGKKDYMYVQKKRKMSEKTARLTITCLDLRLRIKSAGSKFRNNICFAICVELAVAMFRQALY